MRLHDELYFEINASGTKADIQKFVAFLSSGELNDFFDFDDGYIMYNDNFASMSQEENAYITISNDDIGIEISSLNPEDLLDVICSAAARLELHGHIFDIDDEEYNFISHIGSSSYTNTEDIDYSDELDQEARREENLAADDEDYDY